MSSSQEPKEATNKEEPQVQQQEQEQEQQGASTSNTAPATAGDSAPVQAASDTAGKSTDGVVPAEGKPPPEKKEAPKAAVASPSPATTAETVAAVGAETKAPTETATATATASAAAAVTTCSTAVGTSDTAVTNSEAAAEVPAPSSELQQPTTTAPASATSPATPSGKTTAVPTAATPASASASATVSASSPAASATPTTPTAPPPLSYRPLTVPEKLNWVDEILVGQLNALPQPLPNDSSQERTQKLHKVIHTLVPEHRPFYNMYQFHQYVGRGLWPWGYHVRLDRADQFLHCTPAMEYPGTELKPFSVLFRFQPYSHTLPKERRHVYVVHVYHDDLTREHNQSTVRAIHEQRQQQQEKQLQSSTAKETTSPTNTGSKSNNTTADKATGNSPSNDNNNNTNNSNRYSPLVPMSTTQREWNRMYEKLKVYKAKTGHTKVPARYKEDRSLGRWVVEQRFNYNNHRLAQDRIDKLNELDFTWKLRWVASAKQRDISPWQDKYDRLRAYKNVHGHCQVPMNYPEDQPLANWIATQRHKYRTNRLTKEETLLLDQIGFVWRMREDHRSGETKEVLSPKTTTEEENNNKNKDNNNDAITEESDAAWEEKYNQLQKEHKEKGAISNTLLTDWIQSQRALYTKGLLSQPRKEKLESIGFQFQEPTEKETEEGKPEEAKDNANGKVNGKDNEEEDVEMKEKETKKDTDATVKEDDDNGDDWDRNYQALLAFYQAKGHTDVPESQQPLYGWATKQRHNEDNLREDQVQKLDDLGFTWATASAVPSDGSRKKKAVPKMGKETEGDKSNGKPGDNKSENEDTKGDTRGEEKEKGDSVDKKDNEDIKEETKEEKEAQREELPASVEGTKQATKKRSSPEENGGDNGEKKVKVEDKGVMREVEEKEDGNKKIRLS